MEKEYYTPDIQDLHIGYECEICRNYGYESFSNDKEIWEKVIINFKTDEGYTNELSDIIIGMDDGYQPVRTQYLSKEQIESEDWKFETDNNDIHTFLKGRNRLIYSYFSRILWLDDAVRGGQIAGGVKCPSINEFRKIFKLLSF